MVQQMSLHAHTHTFAQFAQLGDPPLPPYTHWYTAYIPTDTGVFPLEVYTPTPYTPVVSMPAAQYIEPYLAPTPVQTPEPATHLLFGAILLIFILRMIVMRYLLDLLESNYDTPHLPDSIHRDDRAATDRTEPACPTGGVQTRRTILADRP